MRALDTLRFAFRSLIRRPAYAAQVIAILALGLGANTAMFGVVDAVLLRPLPYDHAESVVVVFADARARGGSAQSATTTGAFIDWRDRAGAFTGLAALRNQSPRITSVTTPVVPLTHAVTANYFDVLGARPLLGRGFLPGEDAPNHNGVVVLAYGLWQTIFGGDPSIVGRSIDLDGRPHTVVGVMPADFYSAHIFAVQPGLWVAASYDDRRNDRTVRDVLVYGRLKPGVSIAAAQSAMTGVASQIAREHPDSDDKWGVSLVPISEHALGSFTRIGSLVLVAVGLILLIACANVSNLALARGAERSSEISVRAALGAGRWRIAAELFAESLILAASGAAIGVVVAKAAIPAIVHLIPTSAGVPFLMRTGVDARVIGFAVFAALVCAALASLLPVRDAARVNVIEGLRSAGRGRTATSRKWRDALIAIEIAIAVVVMTAAALMGRTLAGLDRTPAGFAVDELAKLRTSLRGDVFASPDARIAHFAELQRQLAALPGVAAASGVSFEPPMPPGLAAAQRLRINGAAADSSAVSSAFQRAVLPGYFETMGIPVLDGRGLGTADISGSARVAVVSRSLAAKYLGGQPPVGQHFTIDAPGAMPIEIVGVVGDVLTSGVDPTPQPAFYVPYTQNAATVMTMVMRVPQGDPAAALRDAERIAWALSPSTNVYFVETMRNSIDTTNWRVRFGAMILGGFSLLGLALAAAGLYAVVAYTVRQRREEIGVRMALGASTRDVMLMVLGNGLGVALLGVIVGDAAAIWLTRAMSGLLYGVAPGDPLTLGAVSVSLIAVAAIACAMPAWSASRTSPTIALRSR